MQDRLQVDLINLFSQSHLPKEKKVIEPNYLSIKKWHLFFLPWRNIGLLVLQYAMKQTRQNPKQTISRAREETTSSLAEGFLQLRSCIKHLIFLNINFYLSVKSSKVGWKVIFYSSAKQQHSNKLYFLFPKLPLSNATESLKCSLLHGLCICTTSAAN